MSDKNWTDRTVAVVAVLGFLLAAWQFRENINFSNEVLQATIEHNRLSVKPEVVLSYSGGGNPYYYFKNHGFGPARITDFHVVVDGREIEGDHHSDRLWNGLDSLRMREFTISQMPNQVILGPGEKYVLIRLHGDKRKPPFSEYMQNSLNRIGFAFAYTGTYNTWHHGKLNLPDSLGLIMNPDSTLRVVRVPMGMLRK